MNALNMLKVGRHVKVRVFLIIAITWSLLNVLADVPHTSEMERYAILFLIILAIINQSSIRSKR